MYRCLGPRTTNILIPLKDYISAFENVFWIAITFVFQFGIEDVYFPYNVYVRLVYAGDLFLNRWYICFASEMLANLPICLFNGCAPERTGRKRKKVRTLKNLVKCIHFLITVIYILTDIKILRPTTYDNLLYGYAARWHAINRCCHIHYEGGLCEALCSS